MTVTDTFRPLRTSALRHRLSLDDFLDRWRDTLLSCLPTRLRYLLSRQEQRLIVVPEGGKAQVLESQGDETMAVGELDPHTPGSLQGLLASPKGGRRRTVVRLAEDQVLKRRVSFPAQARDNLSQVLGYEIDRLSPFQSDQVYFDFHVLDEAVPGNKLRLELALCRRDQMAIWLHSLRDRGAPVDQITWEGAWPRANLLPAGERPQHGPGPFSMNKLLLLLVVLLGSAAMTTPIWQMQQVHDERTAQIAELRNRAEKVHEMRTTLERARQGSVAVLQAKWEQPRMIDLLRELTERLPDDTWIQNFDYNKGEIQIRGESAQATALINLLDQAPGITEVAFRSPVVKVAGSGRERFHISLTFRRPEDS